MNITHPQLEWKIRELIDGEDPFQGDLLCVQFSCEHEEHTSHTFTVEVLSESGKHYKVSKTERAKLLESAGVRVVRAKVRNELLKTPRYSVLTYTCTI